MLHIQSEEWIVTLAIQWESQAASERSPVSGLIKSQIWEKGELQLQPFLISVYLNVHWHKLQAPTISSGNQMRFTRRTLSWADSGEI